MISEEYVSLVLFCFQGYVLDILDSVDHIDSTASAVLGVLVLPCVFVRPAQQLLIFGQTMNATLVYVLKSC